MRSPPKRAKGNEVKLAIRAAANVGMMRRVSAPALKTPLTEAIRMAPSVAKTDAIAQFDAEIKFGEMPSAPAERVFSDTAEVAKPNRV